MTEKKELRNLELRRLMDWVSERVHQGDVLRTSDVVRQYMQETVPSDGGVGGAGRRRLLTRKDIAEALRLHPVYLMNSSQERGARFHRRYRPILTNSLGHLHADLGFEPLRQHYETPKRFRSGYLVAKDILSRFTYVVILKGSKSADSLIGALKELLKQHENAFPGGHRILSLSFDRETAIMGKKVQQFLQDENISFHPFIFTSSKSKHAEGAIKLIRKTLARMEADRPGVPWWRLMEDVVASLNHNPIVVDGKRLSYRPVDVNKYNLADFLGQLHKAKPSYFFGQFDVDPRMVNFKFSVGDLVRPKLLAISSAVVGEKRSAQSLANTVFLVDQQIAYVDQKHSVGRAYQCINVETGEIQVFDQKDIALTTTATPTDQPGANQDLKAGADADDDKDDDDDDENYLPRLRSMK